MFTLFVLLLNFASLAGIVVGLLLKSHMVRDALVAAYVHSSDLASGRESPRAVEGFVDAVIRSALLNPYGTLSIKKMLLVSFVSSMIFSITIGSFVGPIATSAPIAQLFGGGKTGIWIGTFVKYTLAWPGHFIYDYAVCLTLLHISRTGRLRTLTRQYIMTAVRLLAITLAPVVILFLYFLVRIRILSLPVSSLNILDLLFVGVPFFWTGPTFLWIGLSNVFLNISDFNFIGVSHMALFLLSAVASSATSFFDLSIRSLVRSRRAMEIVENISLKISSSDAERIFTLSLTAFAIGNGLCQLFGISLKVD